MARKTTGRTKGEAIAGRDDDKPGRIVQAATILFSRYGFKRTSIDLLAAEADVAKPTVYAYFTDKDAIFRAVVEHVCGELLEAAGAASRRNGPVADRLAAMLSAKFTRHFELVHASPHAEELLGSQGRLGGDIIARADKAYLGLLVSALERAEEAGELSTRRAGLTPASAAALLVRAASGAAYDATTTASHGKYLGEIVRVLVSAMRR